MKPLLAGVLALALGLAAGSSALAMEVKTRHDPGIDFSAYETYVWKAREGVAPEHPLAEGSLLDRKIRAKVDAVLAKAGLRRIDAGESEPDLRLSYVAVVEDELTIEGTKTEVAPGISWVGDPDAHAMIHHQTGTLVISAEDAAREQTVWSGWATEVARDVEHLRKKAEKAATRIAKGFPTVG